MNNFMDLLEDLKRDSILAMKDLVETFEDRLIDEYDEAKNLLIEEFKEEMDNLREELEQRGEELIEEFMNK